MATAAVVAALAIFGLNRISHTDPDGAGFFGLILWVLAGPLFIVCLLIAKSDKGKVNMAQQDINLQKHNAPAPKTTFSRMILIIIGTVLIFFSLFIVGLVLTSKSRY